MLKVDLTDIKEENFAPPKKTFVLKMLKGVTRMRTEAGLENFNAGETAVCPPGDAHQIMNDSAEDFEYLVITNNAPFDIFYHPDSDKVFVSSLLGANKHVDKEARWTRFKEGTVTDYWDGEE